MRICEIIESQNWQSFGGSQSNRVWFNARTGEAITANDDGNHSVAITNNPARFGLTADNLAQAGYAVGEKAFDYDGRVLYAAMRNGWVRIYIDVKNPDNQSNAEGLTLPNLRRALLWYCEQVGTPNEFILTVRTGPGDHDGTAQRLNNEEIEFFIRKGVIPRQRFQRKYIDF